MMTKRTTFFIAIGFLTLLAIGTGMLKLAHDSHETAGPTWREVPVNAANGAVGELGLKDGYAFATLPNQPVGAGFVTVVSAATLDDRLLTASAQVAGRVEIHTMDMQGGVMQMRALPDGLQIPAGETVPMQPGGYHLMLMDLAGPLVADEMVDVTLTFERAGQLTLSLPITKRMPAGGHSGHGDH